MKYWIQIQIKQFHIWYSFHFNYIKITKILVNVDSEINEGNNHFKISKLLSSRLEILIHFCVRQSLCSGKSKRKKYLREALLLCR